jgi:hypothetical protein
MDARFRPVCLTKAERAPNQYFGNAPAGAMIPRASASATAWVTLSAPTLVVLLAAVSLDRIALGLGVIAAFSVGFGAVLTGLALAFVYARRFFERMGATRGWRAGRPVAAMQTAAPMLAGLILVAVGGALAVRSLTSTGVL